MVTQITLLLKLQNVNFVLNFQKEKRVLDINNLNFIRIIRMILNLIVIDNEIIK